MNKKLEQILKEKEKLYVVIDFDKTITAFESADSWDASGKTLEENFTKEMNELYQKYRPIEKDYTKSVFGWGFSYSHCDFGYVLKYFSE